METNASIKNFTGLLIRIDDIAENMNWDLMLKCEEFFIKHNIKPLLGVIPNNEDIELKKFKKKENFWDQIRLWQRKNWEIAMHGFNHVYDTQTHKKDFFGYGGASEFFGHSFERQNEKIKKGLKIFNREGINVRTFFAPNHTYDLNTFKALKTNGIYNIIDGYGLLPYKQFEMNFIPQLFYKEVMLPIGIQSTQVHLNYMDEMKFRNFEFFLKKNLNKIINFETALNHTTNNLLSKFSRFTLEKSLKAFRKI